MNTFVMCAGEQTRFKTPVVKQLLEVNGEILLERTLDMIPEPWFIVTRKPEFEYLGNNMCPENNTSLSHSILSTRPFWDERTVILLGDVLFSKECIDKIYACTDPVKFFMSRNEIFALSFSDNNWIERCLTEATTVGKGEWWYGKLWSVYRILQGKGVKSTLVRAYGPYTELILDGTDDIDTDQEYAKLKDRKDNVTFYERRGKRTLRPHPQNRR